MLQTRFTKALCTRSMSIFRSRAEEEKLKRAKAKRRQPLYSVDPDDEKNLPIYEYGSATPTNRVYTWGMACYGALGVPNYVRKRLNNTRKSSDVMHYPNRCPLAEKRITTSIGCGHGFTVFGIKDPVHHLLGTGINTDGQIGYHAPRKDHPLEILIAPVPTTLAIPKGHNVKSIGCGRAHTIVLSSDNQVFSIGNNAYGQCGRPVLPNEDYFRNRVIHTVKGPWESADEDETIVDVVCGQDHTFFLSTRGQLFSCGWGADGQLGGGDYASQHTPTLIHGDLKGENVVKVASSADCVLALTDQGEVFGWGNSEYGQLASVTDEQQINTPHKLNTRGLGRIKDIAAGGTICLILNDQHDVFVWGYGILGKGPNLEYSKKPELIPPTLFGYNEFNTQVHASSIHAGVHTQGTINSSGELFTWGKNKGSCLGLGHKHDQFFPFKVSMPGAVTKVSFGIDHMAALCKPWA
ncbi:hypothetical protein TCAL_14882 [Tigriopus californicus]|uniref:RCC1-like domain-containing protein n=1 Tax=Tigriopus californicus TaxID=6832 RepID=A0A553P1N5_TIGCA|nr:RCC1-like G exchanging factor-like protein [Tigriopus californicus]TRY71604.1 hypothetical protein TCAL_14882 [Tigriopus californicus]